MAGRRGLLALIVLAAALHAAGIARSLLPAQDGLKFIRIARQFQTQPWADVIRGADQHPLYPALVALAEPVIALVAGHGPDAWRLAAQAVATLAALALLVPLYGLTRTLFDTRIALLAVLIDILLPLPASIGHDTLSDSLALLAALLALQLGEAALRSESWACSLGCGIVAGLGYLARPEVLIVPVAVVLTWVLRRRWLTDVGWVETQHGCRWVKTQPTELGGRLTPAPPRCAALQLQVPALATVFLAMVGGYALVKGEVSEKLALRLGAGLGRHVSVVRKAKQWLPPPLNDGRWDFSPKEESEEPETRSAASIAGSVLLQWADCLCGVFAFFAGWGVVRDRFIRGLCCRGEGRSAGPGRLLLAIYLGLFSLVLVRHALRMGYLSDRHTLTIAAVSLPWAAAGTFVCARGVALKLHWSPRRARCVWGAVVLALIGAGIYLQSKPSHPSRWGHWAAGHWLLAQAKPGEAVLDTRGWAAFVSDLPSYDYWHVRQALSDSHLAYVVVGTGELEASSRRAATLRALLAYAAEPAAVFPERRDGQGRAGVRVYRFHRPDSWEGLRP
jgi:hypothetical protein